jgi:hypothetical protein
MVIFVDRDGIEPPTHGFSDRPCAKFYRILNNSDDKSIVFPASVSTLLADELCFKVSIGFELSNKK